MKTLQVREVPDEVLTELKLRALQSNQSLSAYVLGVLKQSCAVPTMEQLVAQVQTHPVVDAPCAAQFLAQARAQR